MRVRGYCFLLYLVYTQIRLVKTFLLWTSQKMAYAALMPANLGLEGSHVQIHRTTTSCMNLDNMSKGYLLFLSFSISFPTS